MKRSFVFLAIIILSACRVEAGCGDLMVIKARASSGRNIGISVNSTELKKTPPWSPSSISEPPLSITKVVEISNKWAKARYSGSDNYDIQKIDLRHIDCDDVYNHWFYIVTFMPKINNIFQYEPGNWLLIMMDGVVVPPSIK